MARAARTPPKAIVPQRPVVETGICDLCGRPTRSLRRRPATGLDRDAAGDRHAPPRVRSRGLARSTGGRAGGVRCRRGAHRGRGSEARPRMGRSFATEPRMDARAARFDNRLMGCGPPLGPGARPPRRQGRGRGSRAERRLRREAAGRNDGAQDAACDEGPGSSNHHASACNSLRRRANARRRGCVMARGQRSARDRGAGPGGTWPCPG